MQMYNRLLTAFESISNEGEFTTVLKQGWKLYQSQVIQKVNVYGATMINGIVKDVELHAVVLDSEHIRYSTCTCDRPVYCEHMAALFFQYCKHLENGKVLAEQVYFQLLGLVKASSLAPGQQDIDKDVQAGIHSSSDPEAVFQQMIQKYGDDWKKCKHSFHPLSNTLTAIKGMARASEPSIQRLHWCASILFVLYLGERALQAVDSFSRYYHEMTFKRIADPWSSQLYELLEEISQKELSSAEIRWIQAMMGFAFDRVMQFEKSMFEWDYAYYRLIGFMANLHPYNSELMDKLSSLEKEESRGYATTFLNGSMAVLKLGKYEDELGIQYFEKCQFEKVQRLIYPIVEQRMNEGLWDKVELWMDFLYNHFTKDQQVRSLGPYLQLCSKCSHLRVDQSKWLHYLVAFLPHSYATLSEHYLAQQQYKNWADLQMFMGRKPEDFKGNELSSIEKSAPEVLLPLYHQAIDLAIHGRNRQGYRLAAKHMKKLQGLYEQLEKMQIWNQYFGMMQNRYNRLRALQEELLKGKLL